MRKLVSLLLSVLCVTTFAQERPDMVPEMTEIWDPEVSVVAPGESPMDAPSDAIVLLGADKAFDNEWTNGEGGKPGWNFDQGVATVKSGTGVIKTKREFKDFQLHLEWRSPEEVVGESQGRGNSGVFLQGIYEVQVLDNYENRTYRNGQAGSVYKQHPPLVNACKAPGVWQTYDIIYTAPRFKVDGTYFTPPRVTVIHNGVLVQNNVEVRGPTEYIGIPEYSVKPHGDGPLILQDHGNPVSFRNIWIREL
jgi:3-keto-disaccharide hydrolase|tara:strand:- start:37018 stop:37767 length:750 start_codon:yes stop_codon:yes gene_type:complete